MPFRISLKEISLKLRLGKTRESDKLKVAVLGRVPFRISLKNITGNACCKKKTYGSDKLKVGQTKFWQTRFRQISFCHTGFPQKTCCQTRFCSTICCELRFCKTRIYQTWFPETISCWTRFCQTICWQNMHPFRISLQGTSKKKQLKWQTKGSSRKTHAL